MFRCFLAVHWNVLYKRPDNVSDLHNGTFWVPPPPNFVKLFHIVQWVLGLLPWESGQGVALTTHPPTSAKFIKKRQSSALPLGLPGLF